MLTTAQAAALANVQRVTIVQWIRRGHLKANKFGRDYQIDEQDLKQLLATPRKAGRKPQAIRTLLKEKPE